MASDFPQDPRFKALYARLSETRRGVREILGRFLPLGCGADGARCAELSAYHALERMQGVYGLFVVSAAEVQGVPSEYWLPLAAFAEGLVASGRAFQEALTLQGEEQLLMLAVAESLAIQAGRLRHSRLPRDAQPLDEAYFSYLETYSLPGLMATLQALKEAPQPEELAWKRLYAPLWRMLACLPLPLTPGPVAPASAWEDLGLRAGLLQNKAMSRTPTLQDPFDATGVFPPTAFKTQDEMDGLQRALSVVLAASGRASHNIMLRDFCVFISDV